MFRKTSIERPMDASVGSAGVELTDDELEHVVGGLQRTWIDEVPQPPQVPLSTTDDRPNVTGL